MRGQRVQLWVQSSFREVFPGRRVANDWVFRARVDFQIKKLEPLCRVRDFPKLLVLNGDILVRAFVR